MEDFIAGAKRFIKQLNPDVAKFALWTILLLILMAFNRLSPVNTLLVTGLWLIFAFLVPGMRKVFYRKLKAHNVTRHSFFSSGLATLIIIVLGEFKGIRMEDRTLFIYFVCLYAVIAILFFIFEKIAESSLLEIPTGSAIANIITASICGVLVFAVTYTEIYRLYPESFSVSRVDANWPGQFVAFVYFSITTFSTVGYGDIYPQTVVGRILVCTEILFATTILVYVFSLFGKLQEAFRAKASTHPACPVEPQAAPPVAAEPPAPLAPSPLAPETAANPPQEGGDGR